ncbi:uncharacterized protein G2W53_043133 [Senna tora]|uniref:Uncharacterized protein n=1 Tax=Senna tora TaxID=362788 RepID=A0A834W015_9FABA|nr:uncharacterized protein G2W53_043133 [Senna tora]
MKKEMIDGDGWAWEANLKRESKEIGLSFATTLPTCSRYGKRHMISHPGKIKRHHC